MTITTLATIPACVAVVTLLKDIGLNSRWAPLASVLVGVILAIFDALTLGRYTIQDIMAAVGAGIILGLSAAGIYDTSRIIGGYNVKQPK